MLNLKINRNPFIIMASSTSEQDDLHVNRSHSALPAVSRKKNFPESHIMSPLLTKFVRSRWLGIGLVLFYKFMDLKHAKKELGQYPAILTEKTWPITHMYKDLF